jgi:hypothetical protein
VDHTLNQKQPATFTDILRVRFKNVLDPIGAFLNKIGVTPNMITMLGLTGNVLAAFLIARGQIVWGGVVVLLMGPLDAVDGTWRVCAERRHALAGCSIRWLTVIRNCSSWAVF